MPLSAANTLPTSHKKIYSSQSSSYFFQMVEDIGKAFEPTVTQLDRLANAYKSTGEYLASCNEFEGILTEIYPQGSRALGTITRPLSRNHGFDIDLIARFSATAKNRYIDSSGPKQLLMQLKTVIQRYADQHQLEIEMHDRCITLEYADGMRADITPVIDSPRFAHTYGDTYGLIPDRELRQFYATNPKGFIAYFNEVAAISPVFTDNMKSLVIANEVFDSADLAPLPVANEVFGRLLCRIVQMLKIHRDISYMTERAQHLAPSSIFLTALVAKTYSILATQPHDSPLDLVLSIVDMMSNYLEKQDKTSMSEWFLENPSVQADNLAAPLNDPIMRQAFLQWKDKLLLDLNGILQTIENKEGLDRIKQQIENSFGSKAANAAIDAQRSRMERDRSLGKATLITSSASIITVPSRAHSFYGE